MPAAGGTSFGQALLSLGIDASDFTAGVNQIVAGAQDIEQAMQGVSSSMAQASSASSVWGDIGNVTGNVFSTMVSGAQTAISWVGDFVSAILHIPGAIAGAVGALSEWIFFVGEAIDKVTALANAVFEASSSWEQWQVQLTAFTGSGQKANAMLEQIHQFALSTPFEMPGVVTAAERLLAMGTAAQDVIPTLRAVAGAVYATGGDTSSMLSVINLLNRIGETGKMTVMSMNLLIRQGIPAWQILADALGTDVTGAMEKVKSGSLDAQEGVRLLLAGMQKLGDPALSKFGDTWAGAMNNFQAAIEDVWRTMTTALMKGMTPMVNDLAKALQSPAFQNFATGVGKWLGDTLQGIAKGLQALGTWLAPVGEGIKTFLDKFKNTDSLASFGRLTMDLWTIFGWVRLALGPLPVLIGNFLSSLEPSKIMDFISGGLEVLMGLFKDLQPVIDPIIKGIKDFFDQFNRPDVKKAASDLMTTIGGIFSDVGKALEPVGKLIGDFISKIDVKKILEFADSFAKNLRPAIEGLGGLLSDIAGALSRIFGELAKSGTIDALVSGFKDMFAVAGPLAGDILKVAGALVRLISDSGLLEPILVTLVRALGTVMLAASLAMAGLRGLIAVMSALITGDIFKPGGMDRLGKQLDDIGNNALRAWKDFEDLNTSLDNLGNSDALGKFADGANNAAGAVGNAKKSVDDLQGSVLSADRNATILWADTQKLDMTVSPEIDQGSILSADRNATQLWLDMNKLNMTVDPFVDQGSILSADRNATQLWLDMNRLNMTVDPFVDQGSILSADRNATQLWLDMNRLNGTSTWTANLVGGAFGASGLRTTLLSLNGSSTWTSYLNTVQTTTQQYQTVYLQHGVENFAGGYAVVGEAGPELVWLPRGSNVYPNKTTFNHTAAMPDASSGDIHIHVEVGGKEIVHEVMSEVDKAVRAKYGPRSRLA